MPREGPARAVERVEERDVVGVRDGGGRLEGELETGGHGASRERDSRGLSELAVDPGQPVGDPGFHDADLVPVVGPGAVAVQRRASRGWMNPIRLVMPSMTANILDWTGCCGGSPGSDRSRAARHRGRRARDSTRGRHSPPESQTRGLLSRSSALLSQARSYSSVGRTPVCLRAVCTSRCSTGWRRPDR